MRRIVFIAPRLTVGVVCSLVSGLLIADCTANDSSRSPCVGSPDASAANVVSCEMVVVPEPEAGSADSKASSDEVVEPKHDAASLIDTDADASKPDLGHPDVAADVEGESPYRDAAAAVTPCPDLLT